MLQSSASNVSIPHQGTHQICYICGGLLSGVECDDFAHLLFWGTVVLKPGADNAGNNTVHADAGVSEFAREAASELGQDPIGHAIGEGIHAAPRSAADETSKMTPSLLRKIRRGALVLLSAHECSRPRPSPADARATAAPIPLVPLVIRQIFPQAS